MTTTDGPDDGFDSFTRSNNAEFHAWALAEGIEWELDTYELAESAWNAGYADAVRDEKGLK